MGPFILIGLAIYLILIILSVCAYPFVCAWIAIASKKYNEIVTGILLILTVAAYMFACTTLEYPLDDWCYSVYAGIVLTPVVLYICTGVEDPSNWLENLEEVKHHTKTIPILTTIASSLFAIEGIMRMTNSYSIHRLLNTGWTSPSDESFWFYSDAFQYAGALFLSVSIISASFIGISFINYYKKYKHNQVEKIEKEAIITRRLKADNEFIMALDAEKRKEASHYYYAFCKTIINALDSSNEKSGYSFEYRTFNDIKSSYNLLLVRNEYEIFYFYPMGILITNSDGIYKYISFGSTTISLKDKRMNLSYTLPSDVQPIRQYWDHTCLDGSPDLRYKYNPKTYVYMFSFLRIGDMTFHVYRTNSAKDVVSAYNKMYSYLSHIMAKKHTEKMNNTSTEEVASSIDVPKKNQDTEQVNEVGKTNQHIAYNPPTTVEECLCDIIRKHGTDILKDKSLVANITTTYKEVDITEYKDVMEKMVSESFLYQFTEADKQNDFTLYNLSNDFARKQKLNVQKSLFITQALVNAIKKVKVNN